MESEYSFFPVTQQQQMLWFQWVCVCVFVCDWCTWLRGSRFRSLQDLYIRSEKWYSTLRRVFSTSGLQSLRALYCGGTDSGRPSWIPEQPAKYAVRVVDMKFKNNSHIQPWGTDPRTDVQRWGQRSESVDMWTFFFLRYARIQQKQFAYLNYRVYSFWPIHFQDFLWVCLLFVATR